MYLAAVKDMATREIVGWSMSDSLEAGSACEALRMAIQRRQPPAGLIHHTDRGVQGGFNWSSQHQWGGCSDGGATAVRSNVTGKVEVARAAGVRSAGTMLSVLANPVLNRVGLYEGDVRLLHVVRDARSVVAGSDAHAAAVDIARRWDQANRLFRDRRGGDPATYALVRVEEFLRHPGRVAATVAPAVTLA